MNPPPENRTVHFGYTIYGYPNRIIDGRGVILSVNPSACRIFGYSPEEMVGENVKILMPEP